MESNTSNTSNPSPKSSSAGVNPNLLMNFFKQTMGEIKNIDQNIVGNGGMNLKRKGNDLIQTAERELGRFQPGRQSGQRPQNPIRQQLRTQPQGLPNVEIQTEALHSSPELQPIDISNLDLGEDFDDDISDPQIGYIQPNQPTVQVQVQRSNIVPPKDQNQLEFDFGNTTKFARLEKRVEDIYSRLLVIQDMLEKLMENK